MPRRRGVPGLGAPRALAVPGLSTPSSKQLWVIAADAPLDAFGADAINRRISDLDWVSRAAVAHEAIVESFLTADALLPMKLFTIFTSDARALAHMAAERAQIDRVLERVGGREEWSVRVVLDRVPDVRASRTASAPTGTSYLSRKKSQRDARSELIELSKDVVTDLFDDLSAVAADARRRSTSEMPARNGPLLLDAAFLVPHTRASRFRTAAETRARRLHPRGYRVSLVGPWPPYSFLQDA
jgi:hypothetical protein